MRRAWVWRRAPSGVPMGLYHCAGQGLQGGEIATAFQSMSRQKPRPTRSPQRRQGPGAQGGRRERAECRHPGCLPDPFLRGKLPHATCSPNKRAVQHAEIPGQSWISQTRGLFSEGRGRSMDSGSVFLLRQGQNGFQVAPAYAPGARFLVFGSQIHGSRLR